MVGYVADEALRGNLPFPRAREDELLYVLRKLLELRLWSGSLWAALSEQPTAFAVEQPRKQLPFSLHILLIPGMLSHRHLAEPVVAYSGRSEAIICRSSIPFLSSALRDCVNPAQDPVFVGSRATRRQDYFPIQW